MLWSKKSNKKNPKGESPKRVLSGKKDRWYWYAPRKEVYVALRLHKARWLPGSSIAMLKADGLDVGLADKALNESADRVFGESFYEALSLNYFSFVQQFVGGSVLDVSAAIFGVVNANTTAYVPSYEHMSFDGELLMNVETGAMFTLKGSVPILLDYEDARRIWFKSRVKPLSMTAYFEKEFHTSDLEQITDNTLGFVRLDELYKSGVGSVSYSSEGMPAVDHEPEYNPNFYVSVAAASKLVLVSSFTEMLTHIDTPVDDLRLSGGGFMVTDALCELEPALRSQANQAYGVTNISDPEASPVVASPPDPEPEASQVVASSPGPEPEASPEPASAPNQESGTLTPTEELSEFGVPDDSSFIDVVSSSEEGFTFEVDETDWEDDDVNWQDDDIDDDIDNVEWSGDHG